MFGTKLRIRYSRPSAGYEFLATEKVMRTAMSTATFTTASFAAARPAISASAPAPKARLRITARGRAVLLTLVAAPLVAGALAIAMNGGGAIATDSSVAPLETVTVSAGQSLWQLAEQVAPTADPRDFISDVLDLNRLNSVVIQPGQVLAIPAEYSN